MAVGDVLTILNYLKPGTEKPVYYASAEGVAEHNTGVHFEPRRTVIHDARDLSAATTLDRQGFTLVAHNTGISDFYQMDIQAYEAEIRELVSAVTGGAGVVVFDHTLRSDSALLRGQRMTREPAWFVHNDYTSGSARKRLLQYAGSDSVGRPFAIVNVWRTISCPVIKTPVACCDAGSVSGLDIIPVERRAGDTVGELEFVYWHPEHRWYYFSEMNFNESLLIKTFDSRSCSVARRCIHSAFDNPGAPVDAPARESIESRLLVLFY